MLDELEKIKSIDKSNMIEIARKFPENIEEAIKITNLKIPNFIPSNIIITGMGGSAIGGDIVYDWLFDKIEIPIFVNRGYELPKFANNKTLIFVVSYSGNTEETISCFDKALNKKCKIIAITSNGKIEKLCIESNIKYTKVPLGIPPRTAIPYLLFSIVYVLQNMKLVKADKEIRDAINTLKKLRKKIVPESETNNNIAKQIAISIKNTHPVIYGHSYYSSIAKRWRCQLNENSKILATNYEFIEANHNDIVGWNNKYFGNKFSVILLRDKNERIEISKRIELVKKFVYEKYAKNIIEVFGNGKTKLAKMLSLLYIGDFVSIYLAVLNDIDPTPVKIIEELKKELTH